MTDDLPVNVGDSETTDSGDGAGLWTWVFRAGGALVALLLAIWVFNFVVGLLGFVLKWAIIAAIAYGGYRLVSSMLEGGSSSNAQPALPEEDADEHVLEDMSTEDVAASSGDDILDDDLEKEFAELEREMNE